MSRKNGINLKCHICNKKIYTKQSLINRKKYCSKKCQFESKKLFKGHKNPFWKGDKVGYSGIHSWLRRYFGKALKCEKCESFIKVEWALLKGKKYKRLRENFWQLCTKCHRAYDLGGNPTWNKGLLGYRKGHPPTNTKPNKTSFKKGLIPWNKGTKGLTKDNRTSFKKGQSSLFKGRKHTPESIIKIRLARLRRNPILKSVEERS